MVQGVGPDKWIPSRGVPPRFYILLGGTVALVIYLVVLTVLFLGVNGFVDSLRLIAPGGNGNGIFSLYVAAPALILIAVAGVLLIPSVRVGIGPDGVRFVTRLGTRLVPWDSLRPGVDRPRGHWCTLRQAISSWGGYRFLWVTKEQARSILTDPRAPARLFPSEYWSWIDVPPPSSRG